MKIEAIMKKNNFGIGIGTVLAAILCVFFAFVIWTLVKYSLQEEAAVVLNNVLNYLRG